MAEIKNMTEYHEVTMPSGNVAVNMKFDDGADVSMTIRAIPANMLGSILPERKPAGAVESDPVRNDEEKVINKRRVYAWAAAVGSGAAGWYLTLASVGVLPRMGSWVADYVLLAGAVVAWLFCIRPIGRDMDVVASKLASRGPYLRCDLVRKKEERIAKWLMVPFVIWWLPILLAFSGGLVRD